MRFINAKKNEKPSRNARDLPLFEFFDTVKKFYLSNFFFTFLDLKIAFFEKKCWRKKKLATKTAVYLSLLCRRRQKNIFFCFFWRQKRHKIRYITTLRIKIGMSQKFRNGDCDWCGNRTRT